MSPRRALRLYLTIIALVGLAATLAACLGVDLGDGGLIMPAAAIGATIGLVRIRPRTTHRKDRRNG